MDKESHMSMNELQELPKNTKWTDGIDKRDWLKLTLLVRYKGGIFLGLCVSIAVEIRFKVYG